MKLRLVRIKRSDIELIIGTLIILLLLFASGTCFTSVHQPVVFMAVFFVMFVLLFIKGKSISNNTLILILLMFFLNTLTAFFNLDTDFISYMGFFITLLIGFCASNIVEKERFYRIFQNVMLFFCIFSLIMTVISNINPLFILKFPVSEYRNFHTVYGFHTFLGVHLSQINRNCGPFREPGIFEVYLNVALMTVLFKQNADKRRLLKTILLVITVISTESSTGILAMGAIFGGYVFYKPQVRDKIYKHLRRILMIGLVTLVVSILTIPALFLQKLDPSGGSYQSFLTRYISSAVDLELWLKAPIFGQGISKYESLFAGTSNSITSSFAIYGLFFTVVEIILVWRFIKGMVKKNEGILTRLFLFAAMVIILCTQSILFFPFIQAMLFFEAYGLKNRNIIALDYTGKKMVLGLENQI